MKQTTIIIDANNVGFSEHHATKLKSGDLETQAVFGYIRRMRDLRIGYPDCTPIALWDGKAQWRYDLCPSYKSNRDNDPTKLAVREAYKAQRPYIERALQSIGVRQMTAMTHEADDMAGYLTATLMSKPNNQVVLLTGDHDWWQLVRPDVQIRDVKKDHFFITEHDFMDKSGYATPYAFLQGKALQGDTSDVIPGVGGIGADSAPLFLARWGSVQKFFNEVDAGTYKPAERANKNAKTLHPEQRLASIEGRKAFLRNLKMMQLLNVKAPDPKDVRVIRGEPNKAKFIELCEELNFASYLRDVDTFFKPFER